MGIQPRRGAAPRVCGEVSFPVTGEIDRILGDATVSAAAVLTPPATHLELCARFAAAGKHVLLEKPVETTTARAAELVARCRAHGVRLDLVFQHRFKPAAERLKEALAQGRLGKIAGASARFPCGGRRPITTGRAAERARATAAAFS